MKKLIVLFLGVSAFVSCQRNEKEEVTSDFTGTQTTYALQAGSQYPVSGTVTFKQRKDGATTIAVALSGLTDNDQHPVHLHLGDMSTDKAMVAALLTQVAGVSGQSETIIKTLADETPVTYQSLTQLSACVKVHLASVGDEANVILAAGNVGSASTNPSGRATIGICRSN